MYNLEECGAESISLFRHQHNICHSLVVLVMEAVGDPVLVVQVVFVQGSLLYETRNIPLMKF